VIRFQHVYKEYPRTGLVLQDVSLFVGKGEFIFLTGPSGAGKSSLLKLIYMEELPTKGDVWVSGVRAKGVTRKEVAKLRRKLGVVFQDFRLLEDRTAEANVAFALEVIDAPRSSIQPKVARALVNDPFVLIADEPTGNLDERATRGVFQLLRDINASGTAVVMATHNLELVRRSGYRTIEINRGQVVFDSGEGDREKKVEVLA